MLVLMTGMEVLLTRYCTKAPDTLLWSRGTSRIIITVCPRTFPTCGPVPELNENQLFCSKIYTCTRVPFKLFDDEMKWNIQNTSHLTQDGTSKIHQFKKYIWLF